MRMPEQKCHRRHAVVLQMLSRLELIWFILIQAENVQNGVSAKQLRQTAVSISNAYFTLTGSYCHVNNHLYTPKNSNYGEEKM